MNAKRILFICVTAVFLWCVVWVGVTTADSRQEYDDGLVLRGTVYQQTYTLGEPVRIQFMFANNGETTKIVPNDGVEVGSLKILVANKENGEYKEYRSAGWGTEKGRPLDLKPGSTHHYSEVTILWNGKSKLVHFETERKEAMRGRIETEYAFQEPGVYFIKGRSYVGADFKPIESEPIRVEVLKPEGHDLAVWARIRGNREIAYLLQKGSFDTDVAEKKQELIATVEQILTEYPESVYSSYLRPNLEKYKADEVKRKEMIERATIRKN